VDPFPAILKTAGIGQRSNPFAGTQVDQSLRASRPVDNLVLLLPTRVKTAASNFFAVLLMAFVALLVGGCVFTQGKKDAEAVLTRHFQTIATNGFGLAMADYGAQFFQKTTKDEWTRALTKLSSKLGTYQSHTITNWRVFKNAGLTGAGTTVSLECQVTYSRHPATESFTLFKGVMDSEYKIVGHNINSTALLTE
jgi:hypothetical protein